MEFSIKTDALDKLQSDCMIIGVYEAEKLSAMAQAVDALSGGYIRQWIQQGDMKGALATTLLLHSVPNLLCGRVLVVGLGAEQDFSAKQYGQVVRTAIKALNNTGVCHATLCLADLPIKQLDLQRKVAYLVESALEATYRFDAMKSKKDASKISLTNISIHLNQEESLVAAKQGLAAGEALAQGLSLTKDLGNLPPNVCTPTYLAEQAQALGQHYGFPVSVLEKDELEALGMGSFLGVTQGSDEPPKLIVLQHLKGKKEQKPVVLVGKGITFDTGGISLKPGAEMDEMKYDMCGAASVLGTFKAIAEMNLPLNVVGIIPTCENMPSGRATRPGDVLTSMSGLTIEVLNTDAEGRLILCDALTYAERFEPSVVVDIATLTGACVIALGAHASGLFSNNDELARELLQAGEVAFDRAWHMPLWEDYQSQLDSNFADMANVGGRAGGSITAACFLSRFAKKYAWAHLDIAGTAWKSGKEKGGTGRPVPLLTAFLAARAQGVYK